MSDLISPDGPETSLYSEKKRLKYFLKALQPLAGGRVAELGCGTGEALLLPLATAKPDVEFVGIDTDPRSIARGVERSAALGLKNVRLESRWAEQSSDIIANGSCDAVILSEVLEHVHEPALLLTTANRMLRPGGTLLVTIPNGYGPYEIEKLVWDRLKLERLIAPFRRGVAVNPSTLNDGNTHVGFYTLNDVVSLVTAAGFEVLDRTNREWFCGPISDLFVSVAKRAHLSRPIIWLTQAAAPIIPHAFAADWMITAQKVASPPSAATPNPKASWKQLWWRLKVPKS